MTRAPWLATLLALAALPALAAPLPSGAPSLSAAFEGGYTETDGARTRGVGTGLMLAWRFSDQLSATALAGLAATGAGPFSSLGIGLQALFDSTPLAPFLDLQVVLLGPASATGYDLALRTGVGADWRVAPAFAVGLALRTLAPMAASASAPVGVEVVLRAVLTPALLR